MEYLTKKDKLEWLKTRYTVFMYATSINIPLCILLYWLDYKIGFWVLLVLDILTSVGMGIWITKIEKDLDIHYK